MTDVSKQDHYEIRNPQPIDVAIAWDLDYLEGNVLKYLGRWRFKNGVEDLEKMVDYAQRLLARERGKVIDDSSEPVRRTGNWQVNHSGRTVFVTEAEQH